MKKYAAFLIIAGVLVIALVAGGLLLKPRGNNETLSSNVTSQPTPNVQAGGPLTLEEFGDYQCPPCGQIHPTLKELKQQLGPKLNIVFRNLPLSSIHQNALAAAQAAEAARMQNRFWEMHDLLYENQDLWKDEKYPRAKFLKFASGLGLDKQRFERDMESDQVKFRIEADRDAAARMAIDSTPTILINGRQLKPEATNPDGVRKGIQLMLAREGQGLSTPTPTNP